MAKPFSALVAQMSPESRARSDALYRQLLAATSKSASSSGNRNRNRPNRRRRRAGGGVLERPVARVVDSPSRAILVPDHET